MTTDEHTSAESAFDAQLRARLADASSTRPLPAGGLADVRGRLAAGAAAAPSPALWARTFGAGVAAGVLLMLLSWWGARLSEPGVRAPQTSLRPYASGLGTRAAGLRASETGLRTAETSLRPYASGLRTTAISLRPCASGLRTAETSLRPYASGLRTTVISFRAYASGLGTAETSFRPYASGLGTTGISFRPYASGLGTGETPRETSAATFGPGASARDSARTAFVAVLTGRALSLPARWARAIALDTALRYAVASTPADTSRAAQQVSRARLQTLLTEEAAALAGLQASFDSLKAALSEVPPARPVVAAQLETPADSASAPTADTWRRLPPARSPWALLTLLESTPRWSTAPVRAAAAGSERTQASLSESVQLQRQVGPRWLVRAGLGQTTTQTQARRTSERSGETIKRDSTQITDVIVRNTTSTSTLTHVVDSVMMLEPIVNLSGQIIGYDTTWTLITETLTSVINGRDTLRTTRTHVTTRTETWREAREQLFRPRYRFWTVPVAVQYQLLHTNRWVVGVNLGGQLSIFRGGETPVWTGEDYVLQRVSARQGPYRPLSFSASAGLEAAYRLSPRLSAVVAPTVRGWVVAPGRGEAATQRLLPALQVGLTYGF